MRISCIAWLAAFALVAPACGGKVVVDGVAGEGGAGASSSGFASSSTFASSSSFTTSVGPVGPTAVSSSTGSSESSIEKYCAFTIANGCGIGSSVPDCVEFVQEAIAQDPTCGKALEAVFTCLGEATASLESCESIGPCEGELLEYSACVEGGDECGSGDCFEGSDGSCGCQGTCFGETLQTSCFSGGGGESKCDCFSNGGYLGSCSGFTELACDLDLGCCSEFFELSP